MELMPLTEKQSITLVETVLGGTLEELSADVMWDASGGNPRFLRHIVEGPSMPQRCTKSTESGSCADARPSPRAWPRCSKTVSTTSATTSSMR
jgi:hypothetical protein